MPKTLATHCAWCRCGLASDDERVMVEEYATCGEPCAKKVRERLTRTREKVSERAQFESAIADAAVKLRADARAEDMAELSWAAAVLHGRRFQSRGDMLVELTAEKKRAVGRALTISETYRVQRTVDRLWQQGSAVAV